MSVSQSLIDWPRGVFRSCFGRFLCRKSRNFQSAMTLAFSLLLFASPAHAQLFYRALQVNAVAAPVADAATTLWSFHTLRDPTLIETNPLLVRRDGTASPPRLLLLKAAEMTLTLNLLRVAHSHGLDDARVVRWGAYGLVVLLNGLEWRAVIHTSRLPHGARR